MSSSTNAKQIAAVLEEISTLLELKGENPFKSRAYANAARIISGLETDLDNLVERGELSEIRGIGEALSKKITELVTTGKLKYFDDLKATVPREHLKMLVIRGLGPRKIFQLHESLGINTLEELESACKEDRLLKVRGFGRKMQEKILKGLDLLRLHGGLRLYAEVDSEAELLLAYLARSGCTGSHGPAGPLRRKCDVLPGIDLVATTGDHARLLDYAAAYEKNESVPERSDSGITLMLDSGVQAAIRAVDEKSYPFTLLQATGSDEHYGALSERARGMGLALDANGLSAPRGPISCIDEEAIYRALELPFIAPELRENLGEIEEAALGRLPQLVAAEDIRGIFHVHTRYSDGTDSIEALANAARKMGYEYLGISDHSVSAFYAHGLAVSDIIRQHEEIDRLNAAGLGIHLFKGIEVEILPDGRLDYDNDILERFDFIIAAIHSHFNMPQEEMTQRIVRALEHPLVTMLAHPSGRLLLSREPYAVDMDRIIDVAATREKIIELNAHPYRLDLDWRYCKTAKQKGVRISINPDAHQWTGFYDLQYGIHQARKGWLEASDCLNTLPLDGIRAFLKK